MRIFVRLLVFLCLPIQVLAFHSELIRDKLFPTNYEQFVIISANKTLNTDLFQKTPYIFLEKGKYLVDNPIILESQNVTFIHGMDRIETQLIPKNPGVPLILVKKIEYLNISNLSFSSRDKFEVTHMKVSNINPALIELQDIFSENGRFIFNAPGEYRFQGSYITGGGVVASPIILNHPNADLQIVGGNIKLSGIKKTAPDKKYAHVNVKQGRFRIYGTGVQRTLGFADFIISAPTKTGKPHQVINVRSEGSKTLKQTPSAFVYVPKSNKVIDMQIVNSSGAWRMSGHGKSHFIQHYAKGDVTLSGNSSVRGVSNFAAISHDVKVFANNNIIYNGKPISKPNIFAVDNFYSFKDFYKLPIKPYIRPIEAAKVLAEVDFPKISIDIPTYLDKPKLVHALPGMVNVKEYGVKGDGKTDDTENIQKIFKKYKHVFFPEGTYLVKLPFGINPNKSPIPIKPGGWIAGTGRNKSVIINRSGHGVFKTNGMAYATFQDLSFVTAKNETNKATVMSIEHKPGYGHASQQLIFYNMRLAGGFKGIAIGNSSEYQCSENMFINTEIIGSNIAVSIGNYNALGNIFYDVKVDNSEVAFGHAGKLSGGQWSIYGGEFKHIKQHIFSFKNAANGIWFFDQLNVNKTKLLTTPMSGAPISVFINKSNVYESSADFFSGGGLSILGGNIANLNINRQIRMAVNYFNHYKY